MVDKHLGLKEAYGLQQRRRRSSVCFSLHKRVLQGELAEGFMTSWRKDEEEACRQRVR